MIYISSYIIVQTAKNSERRDNQIKQLKTAKYQGKYAINKKLSKEEIRKKTSIPKDPAPNKIIQQRKPKPNEPPNHPSIARKEGKNEQDTPGTQKKPFLWLKKY